MLTSARLCPPILHPPIPRLRPGPPARFGLSALIRRLSALITIRCSSPCALQDLVRSLLAPPVTSDTFDPINTCHSPILKHFVRLWLHSSLFLLQRLYNTKQFFVPFYVDPT